MKIIKTVLKLEDDLSKLEELFDDLLSALCFIENSEEVDETFSSSIYSLRKSSYHFMQVYERIKIASLDLHKQGLKMSDHYFQADLLKKEVVSELHVKHGELTKSVLDDVFHKMSQGLTTFYGF